MQFDDQSINPIKYKTLIRIDEELYLVGLVESICFNQNMIHHKTSYICWEL